MYVIFTNILNYAFVLLLFLFIASIARFLSKGMRETVKPLHTNVYLIVKDLGTGFVAKTQLLREGTLLIGRGEGCDLILEDQYISSSHLKIIHQGEALFVEDLSSANGTYLNGEKIKGKLPLSTSDKLRIGHLELSFRKDR